MKNVELMNKKSLIDYSEDDSTIIKLYLNNQNEKKVIKK